MGGDAAPRIRRGHDVIVVGARVIVVGARVAGAATSLLLARAGLRVLTVDRARFPSDTLSTHQVQVPGVARLHRWGLLDRLVATGTPATRRVRLDAGHVVLDGRFPAYGGVDALYSPRRTNLDSILVEAARAAGAEVREGFTVEELVRDDAGAVTGIRAVAGRVARRSGHRRAGRYRRRVAGDGARRLPAPPGRGTATDVRLHRGPGEAGTATAGGPAAAGRAGWLAGRRRSTGSSGSSPG